MVQAARSAEVARTFSPEECPYETVIVDVTHRCNMACANCYIPNRDIPDLDAEHVIANEGGY
jgi:MoaA/NifB/PqqE/SkfB family radical SAM enzyme